MKIAMAVYTALFFLIYLYGIYARLSELDQDLRGKGHRRTWGGMAMALCSGLMFVSSAAWIGGWAIGTSWL